MTISHDVPDITVCNLLEFGVGLKIGNCVPRVVGKHFLPSPPLPVRRESSPNWRLLSEGNSNRAMLSDFPMVDSHFGRAGTVELVLV